ncbi:MAG: hypothetical protein HQL50_08400 [Magnetococcales bacterium]|nr:hypothetical protein [Magnetococcales bacterium]
MNATAAQVEMSNKNDNDHKGLTINIGDHGYDVYDDEKGKRIFKGIQSWETACEIHEMLVGEKEEE